MPFTLPRLRSLTTAEVAGIYDLSNLRAPYHCRVYVIPSVLLNRDGFSLVGSQYFVMEKKKCVLAAGKYFEPAIPPEWRSRKKTQLCSPSLFHSFKRNDFSEMVFDDFRSLLQDRNVMRDGRRIRAVYLSSPITSEYMAAGFYLRPEEVAWVQTPVEAEPTARFLGAFRDTLEKYDQLKVSFPADRFQTN